MKRFSANTRGILFFVMLVAAVALASGLLPESDNKEAIVSGIAMAVAIAFYYMGRQSLSAKEKQAVEKIRQLRDAGEALAYETRKNLTNTFPATI